jgi:hypothetical protein
MNQVLSISQPGTTYLQIVGMNKSEYVVQFALSAPVQYSVIPQVIVHGSFKDYPIPEPFSITINGKNQSCNPYDTGDIQSSYIDCGQLKYMFTDFPDKDSILFPLSVRQYNMLKNETAVCVQEKERVTLWLGIGTLLGIGAAILAIASLWFFTSVFPYLRLTGGKK